MTVLLIAGTVVILGGLAAIGFGIPVKEFGFGNTLILTGTVGACTGLIMISLAQVLRELGKFGLRSPGEVAAPARSPRRELQLPPLEAADGGENGDDSSDNNHGPSFTRDKLPLTSAPEPAVPPWQDEVLRDRERLVAAAEKPDEPKRRNLLFESSRRERERQDAAGRVGGSGASDPTPDQPRGPEGRSAETRNPEPRDTEAGSFEDAWPQPERSSRSDAIRRAARAPLSQPSDKLPDAALIPDRYEPPAGQGRAPGVVVLKSGVVDGMAYSLYSDGSIEADMPEGLMRFASIDDLREHLDSRS